MWRNFAYWGGPEFLLGAQVRRYVFWRCGWLVVHRRRIQRGSWGSAEPNWLKISFHAKFWINLINLGYHVYPKHSQPLLFILRFSSTSQFYVQRMCEICCMTGKQCWAWSDAPFSGVWSRSILLAQVYLFVKCANLIKSEIILDPPLYIASYVA